MGDSSWIAIPIAFFVGMVLGAYFAYASWQEAIQQAYNDAMKGQDLLERILRSRHLVKNLEGDE